MNNLITYKGIIHFDPINKTKKHELQADWKRMALVMLNGEICEYYAWFIEKRYDLKLIKPLRDAHISFINDSINDIKKGSGIENDAEVEVLWETVKNKWDNKEIEVVFNLDVMGNGPHWWMIIPHEERVFLHNIRKELGLEKPYFGLHMSVGIVNEKNYEHSKYILGLINKFGEDFK